MFLSEGAKPTCTVPAAAAGTIAALAMTRPPMVLPAMDAQACGEAALAGPADSAATAAASAANIPNSFIPTP